MGGRVELALPMAVVTAVDAQRHGRHGSRQDSRSASWPWRRPCPSSGSWRATPRGLRELKRAGLPPVKKPARRQYRNRRQRQTAHAPAPKPRAEVSLTRRPNHSPSSNWRSYQEAPMPSATRLTNLPRKRRLPATVNADAWPSWCTCSANHLQRFAESPLSGPSARRSPTAEGGPPVRHVLRLAATHAGREVVTIAVMLPARWPSPSPASASCARQRGSKLVYRCAKQRSEPPVTSVVPRQMSCTSHRWN